MVNGENCRKILFVTPPYHCGVVEVAGRWVPLGFVYLAGAARQAGVEAEIYDAMTKDDGFAEIEARFRGSDAAYIASTAITSTINDAVKTLEISKAVNPSTVTILGGIHPTFCYEEIFATSDGVDYIVCGEGEVTLKELLEVLEKGGDPAGVHGIAFRRDGKLVKTPKRPFHDHLDDFPAAWDLLEWPDYRYYLIPDSRLATISTSRGCDHDCGFCSQQKFWERSWRARDPGKVADEMEMLFSTYGVNVFLLADEDPTRDGARWEALLDAVIAKGLSIYLLMETRISDILRDRDILWKYRKAGVIHIHLGIEPIPGEVDGSEFDMDQPKLALELIHEQGIVSEVSFMLGFPDETARSIDRTLKLAQHLNPDNAHFLPITPWPYTDLYQEVKDRIAVHDYSKYNLIDPVIKPDSMTLLHVDVAIVDCYRKFYMGKVAELFTMKDGFKRHYLMKGMKLIMNSSFVIKSFGKGIVGKVPVKIGEMKARFSPSGTPPEK